MDQSHPGFEANKMNSYLAVLLVFATIMSLGHAQTFQYSRGWTNGKRNGGSMYEYNLVERLLSNPCQLEKLKYILQGKPINEKLMVPCDLLSMGPSEEADNGLRLKRSPDAGKPYGNLQNV